MDRTALTASLGHCYAAAVQSHSRTTWSPVRHRPDHGHRSDTRRTCRGRSRVDGPVYRTLDQRTSGWTEHGEHVMHGAEGPRLMRTPSSQSRTLRWWVMLALLWLPLTLLAACGGSDSADSSSGSGDNGAENSSGGNSAAVDNDAAAAVYARLNCAACHGPQGEGTDTPRTEIAGHRLIIQQFQTRIRNGRGSAMPGYGPDQITDEEIALLFEWLKGR